MLVEEDAVVDDIDADVSIGGRPNVAGCREPQRSCRVEKSRICTDDDACANDDGAGATRSPMLLATTLPL